MQPVLKRWRNSFGKIFLVVWVLCGAAAWTAFAQQSQIDGAFKFASETTKLDKPKPAIYIRKDPDWKGWIIFASGRFSVTMVDGERSVDWFSHFPKNMKEIGYESFSGSFAMEGERLMLSPDMGLHPSFYGNQGGSFDVRFDGRTLTLTQKLIPYTEDLRSGTRVLVLTKQ